jgi:hypothetical protein
MRFLVTKLYISFERLEQSLNALPYYASARRDKPKYGGESQTVDGSLCDGVAQ